MKKMITVQDHRSPSLSPLNPWFFYPFLIWVIVGGILLGTFDRRHLFEMVNGRHSEPLDIFMSTLTHFGTGQIMILILLILMAAPKFRNWWFVITAVLCISLPALVIQILKAIFNAPRPFEYFKADPSWIHFSQNWGDRLYHHSFPSGHSGGAFSMYCLLALLLPRRYRWLGLPLFLFALLVGYTRLYLAAHFFLDVYVGSILGTLITTLAFWVMNKNVDRFYGTNEPRMSVYDN